MVRDNRHDSAHLLGANCPERRVGAAIIMPALNAEAMSEHLREISAAVAPAPMPWWSAMAPTGTSWASV
jgi:hypothetical protein